jgi:hypothetical protein
MEPCLRYASIGGMHVPAGKDHGGLTRYPSDEPLWLRDIGVRTNQPALALNSTPCRAGQSRFPMTTAAWRRRSRGQGGSHSSKRMTQRVEHCCPFCRVYPTCAWRAAPERPGRQDEHRVRRSIHFPIQKCPQHSMIATATIIRAHPVGPQTPIPPICRIGSKNAASFCTSR